jgi:hypothetical protein
LGFPTGWSFTTHKETSGAINHAPALRVVLRSYPFVRDVIVTEGVVGEHVVIIVFFHLQP